MARVKRQKPVEEFELDGGKGADTSRSAVTRRAFLLQIRGRRLPTPRSKDHAEGEVVFMDGEQIERVTSRKKLKSKGRSPEWAFDFAWPDEKIAVEIEGVSVVRAGNMHLIGGRHGTISGFKEDCEKYAWAAVMGWRLMRFEQSQVANGLAIDMLVRLFASLQDPEVQVVTRVHYDMGDDVLTQDMLDREQQRLLTDETTFGGEKVER